MLFYIHRTSQGQLNLSELRTINDERFSVLAKLKDLIDNLKEALGSEIHRHP